MMLDIDFVFSDVFEAYRQQLNQTPRAVEIFLSGTITGYLENRKQSELGFIPAPHPFAIGEFPWTTPKQRVAFFASNGFGAGIPTTRTDNIANSWETVVDLNESTAGYRNNNPASPFVLGHFQQGFHAITGWRREDLIALDILTSPDLENILIEGWVSIVDIGNSLA
jgi:hypothetical protein